MLLRESLTVVRCSLHFRSLFASSNNMITAVLSLEIHQTSDLVHKSSRLYSYLPLDDGQIRLLSVSAGGAIWSIN